MLSNDKLWRRVVLLIAASIIVTVTVLAMVVNTNAAREREVFDAMRAQIVQTVTAP